MSSRLTLTNRLESNVIYNGEDYEVDLSFDNVLRVFELFSDDEFEPYEKVLLSVEMFVGNIGGLNFEEKDLMLYEIFKQYLGIDLKDDKVSSTNVEKYFDLYHDADMIYAAFLKNYNIDLFEQHGKLHFVKFSVLLNQLLDKNLKKVVDIRAKDLPKRTKYNGEEIRSLAKLKKHYKLKNIDEKPEVLAEQIDSGFDAMAQFFRPKEG